MDYSLDNKKEPGKFTDNKSKGREYTTQDVQDMLLDGYISVHPDLWDRIPSGSHIRYIKRDDGQELSREKRFKPGGFVRNHFENKNGEKSIMIETVPGGSNKNPNYISFPIAYKNTEEIWKKYDRSAFIEIHLITNSLAQKKQQIDKLTERVQVLENILKALIKK